MSISRALSRTRLANALTHRAWSYTPARYLTSKKSPSAEHPGTGNPDILERLPSTAAELSTPAADISIPSEGSSPLPSAETFVGTDWSKSFSGLSTQPFKSEVTEILLAPLNPEDVEIKPDGIIYLPEIKYRRILNRAFGPGAWGLAPRSETSVGAKIISREYALVCMGRFVASARGEQQYFDKENIATATEGVKSNAMMRCCKDLGIASELWDPRFIREFKAKSCVEVFAEHATSKQKKKLWRRKDQPKFGYPWKET